MTRHPVLALALLAGLSTARPLTAQVLDLAFLPPQVAPQDLCVPEAAQAPVAEPAAAGSAEASEPTAAIHLDFLRRDIRELSAEDADRWFDFILTLIDWQAELDPDFSPASQLLARIALHVDAGRLEELRAAGLIDRLRYGAERLDGAEKMALAQYYLNGIGVAPDLAYAQALIRDAAYGGNVDALMSIARMEVRGTPMPGWDAPLDLTVTLAFGGMLGPMNAGVCRRAERIARSYLDADVVTRNPAAAYAWYRFAADLGSATAAWRVVEFQLGADAVAKDDAEMLRYLEVATSRGFVPDAAQAKALIDSGAVTAATLGDILGPNFSEDTGRGRPSLSALFQLEINPSAEMTDEVAPYLDYLRALARFDTAPGWVFTRLAEETLLRKGRWSGEAEAMELLEEAARRGDPEGMRMLARMLVRYRDDPARLTRSVNLLTETVSRFGLAAAMHDLDSLYRCQAPDAPRLAEADHWADGFRATESRAVDISIEDAVPLDPFKDPWILAQIQSQALDLEPQALARMLERVQLDPLATEDARRRWVSRAQMSDKALELFATFEFALATTPAERDLALELFRRIYLNNGVTTALDLAVALIDDDSRDPAIAQEVERLLTSAANRGEGASIRLLARLQDGSRSEADIFDAFAQVIEERGDFLALMFAIPHVSRETAEDYIDRAVSLMACGTKDADELGEAYATLQSPDLSYQWRRIGQTFDGGHILSKLDLSNRQVKNHGIGAAPGPVEVYERQLAEGDDGARRSLFALTGNPDLPTYDPRAAAGHLLGVLESGDAHDEAWVLRSYRLAPPEVQAEASSRFDLRALYHRAAGRGDAVAALELGLLLRQTASGPAELSDSLRWLQASAEAGNIEAMAELGQMLATGLGGAPDREAALAWLDRAGRGGNAQAGDMARLLRLATP